MTYVGKNSGHTAYCTSVDKEKSKIAYGVVFRVGSDNKSSNTNTVLDG